MARQERVAAITAGRAPEPSEADDWDAAWERAWRIRRSRPQEALATARELRDHAESSGDETREARALVVVGSCHGRLGEHAEGLRALHGALGRLHETDKAAHALGVALCNTGVTLEATGDERSAERYYAVSLDLLDRTAHSQGACEVRCRLGRLRTRNGDVAGGLALLEHAVEEADRLGGTQERLWTAQALSEAHEVSGRHDEALRWYKRYHELERAMFNDRSERRLLGLQAAFQLERAEREGNTDPLTGLPNRRYLDRRLREEVVRFHEHGTPLSVVICDLDFFKTVNDTFSHAVGDEVLRVVAGLLSKGIRRTDFCARYGGEEFVVVLTDCPRHTAAGVADAVRRSVREHPWEHVADHLAVTATLGVADASEAAHVEGLLALADQRLYAAKRAGKDRVDAGPDGDG